MIDERDYLYLRQVLRERSGLVLNEGKEYLLEGRLMPVARQLGFGSIHELVQHLRGAHSEVALASVVDAMTTNETLFFRDRYPFTALVSVMLPAILSRRPRDHVVRIWSTAASAGQEPFSIAMQLKEHGHALAGHGVEILASDISLEMIKRAEAGLYTDFEVRRGLDEAHLNKYFQREGHGWRLSPAIRKMVTFKRINLLDAFDHVGVFDIVFCRNVLIYFDTETKLDIVGRIGARLRPDGYLVLGGAETLVGLTSRFKPASEHRALFRLADAPDRAGVPAPPRAAGERSKDLPPPSPRGAGPAGRV